MPDWTFHFPGPLRPWLGIKPGEVRGDVVLTLGLGEWVIPFPPIHWAQIRDFGIHLQRYAEWQRTDAEYEEVF